MTKTDLILDQFFIYQFDGGKYEEKNKVDSYWNVPLNIYTALFRSLF